MIHLFAECVPIRCMHCRLDLAPLNTSTQTLGQVPTRRVWEDVLSVMRIRTFQIIVLQVSSLSVPSACCLSLSCRCMRCWGLEDQHAVSSEEDVNVDTSGACLACDLKVPSTVCSATDLHTGCLKAVDIQVVEQ